MPRPNHLAARKRRMTLRWTEAAPCFWVDQHAIYYIRRTHRGGTCVYRARMLLEDVNMIRRIDECETLAGAKRAVARHIAEMWEDAANLQESAA